MNGLQPEAATLRAKLDEEPSWAPDLPLTSALADLAARASLDDPVQRAALLELIEAARAEIAQARAEFGDE